MIQDLDNSLSSQHILIPGGAGFIGTRLAERLVDDNEVVVYDISQVIRGHPVRFKQNLVIKSIGKNCSPLSVFSAFNL